MPKLSEPDLRHGLAALPSWQHDAERDTIVRTLAFADFSAAWGCMTRIALLAERMDHHPEWTNTYNRLRIVLTTHDAGGLTERDLAMAHAIERLLPDG